MSDTESNPGGSAGDTPARPGGDTPKQQTAPEASTPPKEAGAAAPPAEGGPAAPRKPKIGDTMPAPPTARPANGNGAPGTGDGAATEGTGSKSRRRRRRRGGGGGGGGGGGQSGQGGQQRQGGQGGQGQGGGRNQGGKGGGGRDGGGRNRQRPAPVEAVLIDDAPLELDEETMKRRRGRQRKGRAVGRYQMNVHVTPDATHIAILEGRSLVEHYVSRPADDVGPDPRQHLRRARSRTCCPAWRRPSSTSPPRRTPCCTGATCSTTPTTSRVQGRSRPASRTCSRPRQLILCQVTKNPIAHKGARLTQEVSLPGRFVVLVPNSKTYGISKRLPDNERKRLRQILDKVKPKRARPHRAHRGRERHRGRDRAGRGPAGEAVGPDLRAGRQAEPPRRCCTGSRRWRSGSSARSSTPSTGPSMIDDAALFDDVHEYVSAIAPALADRVQFYDPKEEPLPLFERFHVHRAARARRSTARCGCRRAAR